LQGFRFAICILLLGAVSPAGETPLVVTPFGISTLKIGMTIRQAERALGHKLAVDYTASDSEACGQASTALMDRQGYSIMVQDRIITRIDVGETDPGKQASPIITAEGVGIGSSETAVRKAYGKRLKVEPHPYLDDQGHYLIVDEPGHKRGIIFETDLKQVTSFRAGLYPAVGYIEGCS
jgi:hypothetical protein